MKKKEVKKSNLTPRDVLMAKSWTRSIRHEKEMLNIMSTQELKNMVIDWMLDWVKKPDALTVVDFCSEHKIPRSTLYLWATKDEEFNSIFTNVKLELANKLYKGALKKELDREVAFKPLHTLDPEYLDINRYHASLKKEETGDLQKAIAEALVDKATVTKPYDYPEEEK